MELPGFDAASLTEVRNEAREAHRADKVNHKWVHWAKYVKVAFEALGVVYTPCRSPRECALEQKIREARANAERVYAEVKPAETPVRETIEEFNARTGRKVKTEVGLWFGEIMEAAKHGDKEAVHEALHDSRPPKPEKPDTSLAPLTKMFVEAEKNAATKKTLMEESAIL